MLIIFDIFSSVKAIINNKVICIFALALKMQQENQFNSMQIYGKFPTKNSKCHFRCHVYQSNIGDSCGLLPAVLKLFDRNANI